MNSETLFKYSPFQVVNLEGDVFQALSGIYFIACGDAFGFLRA